MENVPELLRVQGEYARFKKAAQGLGYGLAEDVLNAADYSIPQLRKRAIVVGSRSAPAWPTPTHHAGGYVTVRQALASSVGAGRRVVASRAPQHPPVFVRAIRRAVLEGGNRFDLSKTRPDLLPRCWREEEEQSRRTFLVGSGGIAPVHDPTEFYKPEKGRYLTRGRTARSRSGGCLPA